MEQALRKLQMPGVHLNLEERTADVEAEVCLHEGLLELIACTEGTKEHESIVVLKARPLHVHTALLLFGARAGTPAMQKFKDKNGEEYISQFHLQEIRSRSCLCFLMTKVNQRSSQLAVLSLL